MVWYTCNLLQCMSFSIAKCDKFVIDVIEELLIVYERFYEIYGDILAARNSFNIKAYEMGEPARGHVHSTCCRVIL